MYTFKIITLFVTCLHYIITFWIFLFLPICLRFKWSIILHLQFCFHSLSFLFTSLFSLVFHFTLQCWLDFCSTSFFSYLFLLFSRIPSCSIILFSISLNFFASFYFLTNVFCEKLFWLKKQEKTVLKRKKSKEEWCTGLCVWTVRRYI